MKTIQLTKILNFKRTLAAAALALAALAYATPGQATPHIISFDFSAPGDCSASIFDVAAKYSSCTLKAEAKAAKRGVEPNLAACDAKMVRWTKKSEKKCCSDSIGDPEEHEACIDSLDETIVSVGGSSDPGGDDVYQEDPGCSANTGGAVDITSDNQAVCEAAGGSWDGSGCTPAAVADRDCWREGACGADGWNFGPYEGVTISSTGCFDTTPGTNSYNQGVAFYLALDSGGFVAIDLEEGTMGVCG